MSFMDQLFPPEQTDGKIFDEFKCKFVYEFSLDSIFFPEACTLVCVYDKSSLV